MAARAGAGSLTAWIQPNLSTWSLSAPAPAAAPRRSRPPGSAAARLLVERRDVVGGVCVNAGTVPSKLLRSAALAAVAERESAAAARRPSRIDLRALLRPVGRLLEEERALLRRELDEAGVELVSGDARLLSPHRVRVSRSGGAHALPPAWSCSPPAASPPGRPARRPTASRSCCPTRCSASRACR